MFLETILIPSIFPIITFIVVPPKPKLPSGFSNILLATAPARKKINSALIVTIKLMIDFKRFSSDCAKKIFVSHTLTHTSHRFLPQPS